MDTIFMGFQGSKRILLTIMAALLLLTVNVSADDAQVPMNVPETLTANITPGTQFVEIPFSLSQADGVAMDLIVPVEGSLFSLYDPAGNLVLNSTDPRVKFTSGAEVNPASPLPGGFWSMQELANPANGNWKVRLDFPPATVSTVAVASVFVRTLYQAGIAIARDAYLVGEDISMGMLVLNNGQPITGLNPALEVSLQGSGDPPVTLTGRDDGVDADGLANDGVYSAEFTFQQAGTYTISGMVNIGSGQGTITRKANRSVTVTEPPLSISNIATSLVTATSGCVEGINETVTMNVAIAGEYVAAGSLAASSGAVLNKRSRAMLPAGVGSITLFYSAKEITQQLNADGPYQLPQLDVLRLDEDFSLAARARDNGTTDNVSLDMFCREAIVIGSNLVVEPILQDGYIGSLLFKFPITVQLAGSYQISVKVIGAAGEDIDLVAFRNFLPSGMNEVSFSIPAEKFQAADGPYAVISALVLGTGGSAQLSQVGKTAPYVRWQFYPTHMGDLDNDGDVDADDRSIVLQARNQQALSPGDRRDISRDGVINIRDARAILGLQ